MQEKLMISLKNWFNKVLKYLQRKLPKSYSCCISLLSDLFWTIQFIKLKGEKGIKKKKKKMLNSYSRELCTSLKSLMLYRLFKKGS